MLLQMLLKLSSSNRNLHSVNWHINILSSTQSKGQGYAHFDCEYLVNGYTVTGQVNVTIAINIALTICCRMLVSLVDLSPRFDIIVKHIIIRSCNDRWLPWQIMPCLTRPPAVELLLSALWPASSLAVNTSSWVPLWELRIKRPAVRAMMLALAVSVQSWAPAINVHHERLPLAS